MTDNQAIEQLQGLLQKSVGVFDKIKDGYQNLSIYFTNTERCDEAFGLISRLYPELGMEAHADYPEEFAEMAEAEPDTITVAFKENEKGEATDFVNHYAVFLKQIYYTDSLKAESELTPAAFENADKDAQIFTLYNKWLYSEAGKAAAPYKHEIATTRQNVLRFKLLNSTELEAINAVDDESIEPPSTLIEVPLSTLLPQLKALEQQVMELAKELKFVLTPGIAYVYLLLKDPKVSEYMAGKGIKADILAESAYASLCQAIHYDDGTYTGLTDNMKYDLTDGEDNELDWNQQAGENEKYAPPYDEYDSFTPATESQISEHLRYNDIEGMYERMHKVFAGAAAISKEINLGDVFKAMITSPSDNYLQHMMAAEFNIPLDKFKEKLSTSFKRPEPRSRHIRDDGPDGQGARSL